MNHFNIQPLQSEARFRDLEDIKKIKPLATSQEASIYTLNLHPAERWYKPKALTGVLFLVLVSGQVLFQNLRQEAHKEKIQFMHEDATRFITSKDSFSIEPLYNKTKLLILQLPSEASYANSIQVDLRYFSDKKEAKHVSKKMDEQRPLYN